MQSEMEKDGVTTMEKKKRQSKKTSKDLSKNEELVFTESTKPPCENCKEKETEIKTPLFTQEEMDKAMTIVDRFNITPEEMKWLINLNNRVNNDNKMYGCGKCHIRVIKNLKNAYQRLYR